VSREEEQEVLLRRFTDFQLSCSFIRFMLRCLVQFALLTPKPPTFVQPPDQQPFVGAVLGANILCIALHLWFVPVTGTEATRGYLHGGLAMDFIGQKGPASRFTLVLFDLLVMTLQFVHLTAHITRKRLKDGAAAAAAPTPATRQAPAPSTGQDLDSEERGVRHSTELEQRDDIEMQTLNPSGGRAGNAATVTDDITDENEATNEREALLSSAPPPRTDIHIFDSFHSGQIVLADLNIWKTVREQFWAYQKSTVEQRDARRASYRAQLTSRLMDFGIARLSR
jgi:hypothetical protein